MAYSYTWLQLSSAIPAN